jgi:type I restriction enzyme S subunit
MITDLKPYPAMKDSGVPWLGQVPEHWDVRRLKWVSILNPSRTEARSTLAADMLVTFLPMERVGADGRIDVRERPAASSVWNGFTYFKRHDVLVAKITPCFENGKGACLDTLPTEVGFGSTEFHVLRARSSVESQFLYRLTTVPEFRRLGADAMTGAAGQQRVPQSFVANFTVPLPPLPEQSAIVRFLDHVDRRIRRYIRAKQKLIKLLEEQKQAIIHRAVTRGLDPNVRLKPSGVDWLGDVPEHWEVAALRHRYSQCLGKMLDSKRITGNHSLPYLRNTDVQWDRVNIEDLPMIDIPPAEYSRYTVQPGDLLVCEGGEVGRCALWSGELAVCGFQKALHRLRPMNPGQDIPRFMHYALWAAAKGNAFNDGHLSTIAHLTGDKLRAHRFPFPPVAEQESLVSLLDARLKEIDQAVSAAQREISLLREYRTRLIADVVTGKLDVREAAAKLPDEAEEPERLDDAGRGETSFARWRMR